MDDSLILNGVLMNDEGISGKGNGDNHGAISHQMVVIYPEI